MLTSYMIVDQPIFCDRSLTNANGSKLLVDALKENGAKHLFALVGSDTIPVFDVLSQTSAIQVIGVRHERAAGHMADGYARVSREPGVCLVHNGPGLKRPHRNSCCIQSLFPCRAN